MTDPDILDLIKKVETIRSEPGDAKEYEEYTDGWIDACNSVLDLLHSGLALPEPDAAPAPAASLVERVSDALMESTKNQGSMARAAIREVAAWLRENDAECQMGGDADATANLLEDEVNHA